MPSWASNTLRVEVTESVRVCRDPRDDKFLALAIDGKASHIVTNDQDLLVMGSCKGIPIATPGDFVERVGRGDASV